MKKIDIKAVCIRLGLNQKQLSDKLMVSEGTVNRWSCDESVSDSVYAHILLLIRLHYFDRLLEIDKTILELEGEKIIIRKNLVAGVGFEPTTFGL